MQVSIGMRTVCLSSLIRKKKQSDCCPYVIWVGKLKAEMANTQNDPRQLMLPTQTPGCAENSQGIEIQQMSLAVEALSCGLSA